MSRARALMAALGIVVLWSTPSHAQRGGGPGGTSCSISVTGVSFGSYDVFASSSVASTGAVIFQCGAGARNITVTLSPGQSGSFASRAMAKGSESLTYNLYRDAAHTTIWGDGTAGTQFYADPDPPNSTDVTLTIYAEIPALQDVSAGSYTDTVTAVINF